jgi:hypothetical protein
MNQAATNIRRINPQKYQFEPPFSASSLAVSEFAIEAICFSSPSFPPSELSKLANSFSVSFEPAASRRALANFLLSTFLATFFFFEEYQVFVVAPVLFVVSAALS